MRHEKLHAVVARRTFPSQKDKATSRSDHVLKLSCRKSVRRCGAKHISKSKCTKHTTSSALLEVERLRKWTPLWGEAHFQVKMYKAPHVRTTFDGSVQICFAWQAQGIVNLAKSEQIVRVLSQFQLQPQINYTTLHYTTLHSTPLQHTTPHHTTLPHTTLHYTTLHYTTQHYTTLHYTTLNCTKLHYTYSYNHNYN